MEGIGRHSLGLLDSNVTVYALVKDYPTKKIHKMCLKLLEKGLKGEIAVLCLNPIMLVETFSALAKLLSLAEAEYRISSLLRSKRLGFLTISRPTSESAVSWAKESEVPVNDTMIASLAVENSAIVYTADERHFNKLKRYGVIFQNPIK